MSDRDPHSFDAIKNILNKLGEAGVLVVSLEPYAHVFRAAGRVVELGAGQGWASAIVKRLCPQATVIATDVSVTTLRASALWVPIFDAQPDYRIACASDALPLANAAADCVFAFAAAHHFTRHRQTLTEIYRILRPGGHAFYFNEPSCPRLWYTLARWRVNRKRPGVAEDVLISRRIMQTATKTGFYGRVMFCPITFNRGPLEAMYYSALKALPFLRRMLPCTATFYFRKP